MLEYLKTGKTEDCFGCAACIDICPKLCLVPATDDLGFMYPQIDISKCISCGLCENVCPISQNNISVNIQEVYGAWSTTTTTRLNSSSGGIFTELSNFALDKGYLIYGAAFDNDFLLKHTMVNNKQDLSKIRGSKYVQSNMHGIYKEIYRNLSKSNKILFSGTPCQVSALKSYCKRNKNYSNLFTLDLVCHGVPSNDYFKKYISFLQNKYNSKVESFDFRNKEKIGWSKSFKITFEDGRKLYRFVNQDSFGYSYEKSLLFRKSCYSCPFANNKRVGDMTLADFWGVNKSNKNIEYKNGVSLIILNSAKGKLFFQSVSSSILSFKVDSSVFRFNSSLFKPAKYTDEAKLVEEDYKKIEFESFLNKNLQLPFFERLKVDIKYFLIYIKRKLFVK